MPQVEENPTNIRTIFEFPAEKAEVVDCLADDPVWCEVLSAAKFPDHQEKIQGILAISGVPRPTCNRKSLVFCRVFVRIPYSTEQGILKRWIVDGDHDEAIKQENTDHMA